MRNTIVCAVTVGVLSLALSAQGARNGRGARGAAAAATTTTAAPAPAPQAAPAPPAARGRGGPGPAGPNDFYDYSNSASEAAPIRDAAPVETPQKISLAGTDVSYTARAGYMPINNATTGQPEAHIFYTYYSVTGATGDRPVLFVLGGAPGSAASWLELDGFGPKRLAVGADGTADLPPYHWQDNPDTLLGRADLVFVNPIGTGFSRVTTPSLNAKFSTPAEDAASLGEFVRSFLAQYDRWNSPRYIAGEDRGTGRVATLASYLTAHEIPLNGAIVLSTAVATDADAGDEKFMTLLPSLVLTSWYHKKLSSDLQAMSAAQVADVARQFASREYLHALYQGDRMPAAERAKVIADLARLTGLSKAYIANNDLRLTTERYDAELLREQHETLSDSDSRYGGYLHPGAAGGRGGFGAPAPSLDARSAAMANGLLAAYEQYLRHDLHFDDNGVYYLQQGGTAPWTATATDDAGLDAAWDRNPAMRVFVALNYFDLNSPFYAGEFTIAHLSAPAATLRQNLTTTHFEAGSMPYADAQAGKQLTADLAKFIHN
ncbi:MAG TPA: hypothetical protein VIC32_04205 [Terriglobales bacterium]